MESIKISVVTPNGISVMRRVFRSRRMRALMRDAARSSFSVTVVGGIHHASGRKVRQKLEGLAA